MIDRRTVVRHVVLFYGLAKKEFILLVRYKIDTLTGLLLTYGLFALILFGGRSLGGSAFNQSVGAVVVGFSFWIMSAAAYQSLAGTMEQEASWGTLEQLHTSPFGFNTVIVLLALTGVLDSLLRGGIVFVAALATAGLSFQFDLLGVLATTFLGVASILGVGFTFGAVAVRYKRVDNLVGILSFLFTGLIAAPVEAVPALRVLPLAQASYLLRRLIVDGVAFTQLSARNIAILLGVAVVYPLVGYAALRYFINDARRAGVLGHY